jgi:hypothetical protein
MTDNDLFFIYLQRNLSLTVQMSIAWPWEKSQEEFWLLVVKIVK